MDIKPTTGDTRVRRSGLLAFNGLGSFNMVKTTVLSVVLIALVVIALLPFYMAVIGSLKTNWDLFRSALALPPQITWDNYAYVVGSGFLRNMLNTVIVNIICLTLITFVGSLAAFSLSRMRVPGRNLIRIVIISGLMIPVYAVLFPLYAMMEKWGLTGSYLALIGPYVGFGLPFAVFVLTGYMKNIPQELDEAAKLDGASPFRIYSDVILPLCRPGLAAVLIFEALWIWNEVPFALVLVRENDMKTLAVALLLFGTNWSIDWPKTLAAACLVTFPILLVYFALSEQFIRGLTAGAIKQ